MKHFLKKTLCGGLLFAALYVPVHAQNMNEMWGSQQAKTTEKSGTRGHLFEWGNYAMFIHWGLFSQLANQWNGKTYYGIGEWMMNGNMANIDPYDYKKVAGSFNPTHFDAMKIAQLAKDAGMKYIIITSKHHEGFAMYHSRCDKFNIVDSTPFGRDPMKELSEACRTLGLGFGFYYSHNQDWTTPGGSGGPTKDSDGNQKTFDDYFHTKCLPQVEEITKNYGDIELIWFDTPGGIPEDYAKKLVETVHRNQPNALVSGRVGYDLGDYQTLGDMEVPPENIEGLWESVDVTNDSWGYAWYDQNWKSPKQILTYLISTVARGGTYMLNIGLDGKGDVPEFALRSLRTSGKWINCYPQVVYGAGASPWKHALPWGDVVRQGNKLYLAIYEWPASGKLYLPGLQSKIVRSAIVNGKKKVSVKFKKEGSWTMLQVPFAKPDPLISVIELTMEDEVINVDNAIALDPEIGINDLSVIFAKTVNCKAEKLSWMEKFGEWKHMYSVNNLNKGGKAIWTVNVKESGVYHIDLKFKGDGRVVWKAETDEGQMAQNQQGASSIYGQKPLGLIRIDKPGTHTIAVSMPEGGAQANLASISITPVYME